MGVHTNSKEQLLSFDRKLSNIYGILLLVSTEGSCREGTKCLILQGETAFRKLKGHGKITEINVAETLKEIRRALIDADVNYKVAKEFTKTVKEKALGKEILISVMHGQLMNKIVHEELSSLMGGANEGITMANNPPTVILISGLQGSGMTTFTGKLAKHFKSNG